jgi:hypothetical protein
MGLAAAARGATLFLVAAALRAGDFFVEAAARLIAGFFAPAGTLFRAFVAVFLFRFADDLVVAFFFVIAILSSSHFTIVNQ